MNSITTPDTTLAPLGLDDPAPVLVWRNGGGQRANRKPPHLRGYDLCHPTRDDAERARLSLSCADDAPDAPEPFRIVLEEYLAGARRDGRCVALVDGNLRILEVYE